MRMEDYRIPNMGKLKALLIKYLEEYREKDDYTYQLSRQSLHGEIKDLKQLLRNINDVSKIVSDLSIPNSEEAKNEYINVIKSAIEEKVKELNDLSPKITYIERKEILDIIYCIKNKKVVENYEILLKLFKLEGLSEKEQIDLFDAVKINNNISSLIERGKKIDLEKLMTTRIILDSDFEEIKDIYIDSERKSELDLIIKNIIQISNTDSNNLEENLYMILPEYIGNLRFRENYSIDEFKYIMENLLKNYQDIMFESKQNLEKLDIYLDNASKFCVTDDYEKALYKYKLIRNYYFDVIDKYDADYNKLTVKESIENELVYASNTEDGNSYLENDLKNIPNDRYDEVKGLLMRFKTGTLGKDESKKLYQRFPKLQELRSDQIRIPYRHVDGNKYVILGVILKKVDMDGRALEVVNNRNVNFMLDESVVEPRLFEYLEEEKDLGGRKKG